MSDGCEKKSLNFPLSISVSHLLFLFITAHSFAPSISANLRQNSSQSPGLHSAITWAFSMLYYHLISLFSVTHLPSTTIFFPYLIKARENPPKQNEFDTCDVYVMDGRTGCFFSTELFVCFVYIYIYIYIFFFWSSEDTAISFGRDGKRRNSSPPALSASVLCGPGHFGGLDKIFIPFNP